MSASVENPVLCLSQTVFVQHEVRVLACSWKYYFRNVERGGRSWQRSFHPLASSVGELQFQWGGMNDSLSTISAAFISGTSDIDAYRLHGGSAHKRIAREVEVHSNPIRNFYTSLDALKSFWENGSLPTVCYQFGTPTSAGRIVAAGSSW